MRFPHVISKNTLDVYSLHEASLKLISEDGRQVFAENLTWDNELCPSLVTLCVQAIAKSYKEKQYLEELPCAENGHLLEILPTDLPLEIVVPLIEAPIYWQRRYADRYGIVIQRKHSGWTWKCLFLERYLREVLEEAQPQYKDEDTFGDLTKLLNPYIHKLSVTQLQPWKPPLPWSKAEIPIIWPIDHISFIPILKNLKFIEEVEITYGLKDVGTDFVWNMFRLSVDDCRTLSKAILCLKLLKIFRINKTAIDCDRARALAQNVAKNKTLVELDFSHCLIGDQGALCVAKVMLMHRTLTTLKLANNKIGAIGAEGIGFALLQEECCPLETLDMRLNPLAHDGVMGILRAMVRGNKPERLILAACQFEDDTSIRIGQTIRLNTTLKVLDVSSNWFDEAGSREVLNALSTNRTLHWLDLRDTDVPPDILEKINKALLRNRLGLDELESEISEEVEAEAEAEAKPEGEEEEVGETEAETEDDKSEEKENEDG